MVGCLFCLAWFGIETAKGTEGQRVYILQYLSCGGRGLSTAPQTPLPNGGGGMAFGHPTLIWEPIRSGGSRGQEPPGIRITPPP